ncbi:phage tail protein [Actinokineospora inagensis]|uniref:phage tail protein n=1 Tax=Actinokineospora inagensis TaxID=103730 RepID=UPI00041489A3|nr:phage tail protein [Actinokineospora inagensis]
MRTASADVPVRHPIGDRLPGIYAENEFTQRFTAALDEVFAPVFAVLDAYADLFDPALTAPDFLDWLGGWVALEVDERWSVAQRRALVAGAVRTHRLRGTAAGLADQVRVLTGLRVRVDDSGGCVVRAEHGGPLPGSDPGVVRVDVLVDGPLDGSVGGSVGGSGDGSVDVVAVRAAVAEFVPVHVRVEVRVVTGDGRENG